MFDHLLTFPNEATARAMLAAFIMPAGWDESRVLAPVRIVTQDAVWDMRDPERPKLKSPEKAMPGFHLVIALATPSPDLMQMAPCLFVADRAKAAMGEPFLVYASDDLDLLALAKARVEPMFAGANYDFAALA